MGIIALDKGRDCAVRTFVFAELDFVKVLRAEDLFALVALCGLAHDDSFAAKAFTISKVDSRVVIAGVVQPCDVDFDLLLSL